MSTGKRIYRPRELSRRQFLGLGAAGAGLLLAGCGGGGQGYGEGGGGGAAEFHGAYPYQLPPIGHYNTFVTNAFFQLTLYQDVLEMPMAMYRWAERKYVPYMATEWGYEPPDVFKVTLRKGAKWSDGSEFTSKDIVATFNILRLQEQLAWNYLASVEPDDEYNLTFKMKDPSTVVERLVLRERIRAHSVYGEWSDKAQQLFDSDADSESKEYRDVVTKFEEFRPEQLVVSGPYNIDKKSITESQLTMDKVDTAWNADRTNFDRMIIYNGEVPAVTPIVLSKDIDYATHGFPLATEKSFKDQGIRILRPPTYSGPALYFNYAKIKAVADPKVRQAIAHAVDMYENATVSLADSARRSEYMTGVSDVLIKDWVSEQDLAGMNPYEHDPDKATSMMEDLGFEKDGGVWVSPEGERMEYELGAPAEFADWSAAAKNLADQLTSFGIKTTVRTVTFTQWEPRVLDGQFEMGIQAWGQGQPHPVYSFQHPLITYNVAASGGGISYDMTQDTESFGEVDLEELIIQTASGLDEEGQKATVTKLSKIFNELLPVIPLWERLGNNPALDGERVTGWLPDSNPIYQNSPYEDSFAVMMIMDGTLKPAGQ
ncbi:MAG: ABC transporter, substrate-binding protein (cluster 5, nickel/peptides/opines) [uncultured Rubrobacteraceae bacterium]|uniref:ABC transporter, substrate-binding protein (Cluster 5, nickel/peptides/opines) n=1 Tax=uncultured Rubrobacteraceae bacterium TaxID=349277 RepID=A0A6J4QJR6_9ACTN|nr:MAG: ABC transporter, substrate-binding protein (cluster 5, nickel/peptides/opines) [uncultured Rubrobacteraceae bacterium]